MAKKKQEIQLMQEVESQEEWEDIMTKEGLWVVDVFQEWSGPCDAMISNFRRIKNELGDDLLHFAKAKADTIESLEKYRGSCEPCYLFFAAGVLVSYVHGANAPLILRTLTEQLAQEHKVIDGTVERKEVKDPFVANREAAEEAQKDEEEEEDADAKKFQYNGEVVMYGDDLTPAHDAEEVEEGYTVAIIKPNVVAAGKVDDILEELKAKGIQVIAQEERKLTEDEAKEFYSHLSSEEYFNDLVSFMSSGPSHVLVLTKGQEDDSIIKDWRDMLGPPTVEDAKEKDPESLRARYGEAGLMNALHGSDSKETAARELAFFFPNMHAPTIQKKKKDIQRTLALIRPEAFAKNKDEILQKIKEAGFQIALQKEVVLTKEQAEEFYREHEGQHYYEELTKRMSSGPLMALGLAREDAVENWRGLLGPTDVEEAKTSAPDSLRAQFAVDDDAVNQIHGSDSVPAAQKELQFFFPMQQTVAMIKPDAMGTKDAIIDKIHQAGFRIAARKETTITRDIAEQFYDDQKDKEYFNDLVESMTSGPTMFMVLSKEDAVEGWRKEIGPTDPEQAKEQAPDSLRAQFGHDILHNAVHGASSVEEANRKIEAVFGGLEFNPDGSTRDSGEIQQDKDEEAQQQQQAEQQQEQSEQPQEQPAEQPAEEKPVEQEAQQAEQPAEAEGKAEGEGQSGEKPAESDGKEAEKKEDEGEQKPSEPAADKDEKDESAEKKEDEGEQKPSEPAADKDEKDESAEKKEDEGEQKPSEPAADKDEKDESAEKTEDKVEEKPTEPTAESAQKDDDAEKTEDKVEEKPTEPTAESAQKDDDAGQNALASEGQAENKAEEPKDEAQEKAEEPKDESQEKAGEAKDETQEKAEDKKEA
ncbi:thioredoxin domain-containing protein 6-like isoform X3 [Babylonia areolata]|uniref:thioredoxin domain-containing protein 6-like isoform X3 n=1 Tax=Babylonia areolata TaxID=304850 RepID=UPI003FD1BFC0